MSEFEKDLANVMGSFIQTELDCVEKQNQEIERLQQENNQLKEVIDEITKLVNDYEECEKIIGAGKPMFPLYKLQNIIHKVKEVK